MDFQWLTKEEFWRTAPDAATSQSPEDDWFLLGLPLNQIRARTSTIAPEFTPADEGDFPGPVERWYGIVGNHRFMLTYHYGRPPDSCAVVQHAPGPDAAAALAAAFARWKNHSPY